MPNNFPWAAVITSITAAIAIVISLWSLIYSHNANRIAGDALNHSKLVFAETQRPRLQLKPSRVDGTSLICKNNDGVLHFIANFSLKNTGKTPAQIVSVVESAVLHTPEGNFKIPCRDSIPILSLSPDQNINVSREATQSNKDPDFPRMIMEAWSKEKVYMEVDIAIKYTADSSQEPWIVHGSYRIHREKDEILVYEEN